MGSAAVGRGGLAWGARRFRLAGGSSQLLGLLRVYRQAQRVGSAVRVNRCDGA